MTTITPFLQWSEELPSAPVSTGEQLDQLLDQIQPSFPISAILEAHGVEAHILLGLSDSFVYLNDANLSRYHITIGNPCMEGFVSFQLLGQHHTEFQRRHLIPYLTARRVLREFFDTGHRSAIVEWEVGTY